MDPEWIWNAGIEGKRAGQGVIPFCNDSPNGKMNSSGLL
jgi:hypothetical protein